MLHALFGQTIGKMIAGVRVERVSRAGAATAPAGPQGETPVAQPSGSGTS